MCNFLLGALFVLPAGDSVSQKADLAVPLFWVW